MNDGIGWTAETIESVFSNDITKKTRYLKKLDKIDECGKRLKKEIEEFVNLLEKHSSPLAIDFEESEKKDENYENK